MRIAYIVTFFVVVLTVSVMGFRGSISTKPPLEVFPDMDRQAKFKPQVASTFFADGRADRPIPAGTVPYSRFSNQGDQAFLAADDHLYLGKTANGQWAVGFPAAVPVDAVLLERGKERFTINCAPCHGALGDGNGITKSYGMGGTPTYHDARLRDMADGEIFNTITNGKNTMGSYADKVTPPDRWAIIAYVRALQRAQTGKVADVLDPAGKQTLGLK